MKAVLSLGSNLGNRIDNIFLAIKLLNNANIKILKLSKFYETQPWGFNSQNWFINAACLVQTSLHPFDLLFTLQKIEKKLGRKQKTSTTYSSRTIDLDIIFYENLIINSPDLTIPHPRLHLRNFVLYPLNDIVPNWKHPVLNLTVSQLLKLSKDNSKIYLYNGQAVPDLTQHL